MIWQVVSRNGIAFDPFSELSRMNRSMDQLFGGYSSRSSAFPPVNVWGGENEAVVTAEIPGVDPKSLSLSVMGDILTIEGERKADEIGADNILHRCERNSGAFSRAVRLPYEIEGDTVKATSANGVLRVTLARKESSKPRKIEVQAE